MHPLMHALREQALEELQAQVPASPPAAARDAPTGVTRRSVLASGAAGGLVVAIGWLFGSV